MFSSFKGLVCCSAGTVNVVADCTGIGVLSSISELPHASKLSGMSCTDGVVSLQELRDVDIAKNKDSSVKHQGISTVYFKYDKISEHASQGLRKMHDKYLGDKICGTCMTSRK